MTLTPGTRLGPYEVVAQIGAGGMGEVYRARDTRLDRTVALKILPHHATTTEAKERFEREARAISSLNHPNICTLFDVGSEDGVAYLVMELVEGETLASRLAKGALPLDVALKYGASIADALAKAHRHGIVHRDLKPANVMMTKSGAKLLDFGLARRAESLTSHDSPTVIGAPITSAGMIVGTLPYMPPEQLEGKPTDARSDIFALGAVLYEMITGRRAFDGDSQASLITKIMSQQPVPIASLQPVTPPALERLIAKCLEKDPDDRWQSAADVASELRWIGEGGAIPSIAPRRRGTVLPWAIAAASLLLSAGALFFLRRGAQPETPTIRFAIPPPQDSAFPTSFAYNPAAVSPDGLRIAFTTTGEGRLRIHDLMTGTSRAIDGTNGAASPFWSPDGRTLGFVTNAQLKKMNIDDGNVQTICDVPRGDWASATWLADGTIVYALIGGNSMYAVPAGGGTPRKLFSLARYVGVAWPERIGTTSSYFFSAIDARSTDLFVGNTSDAAPRAIARDVGRASYDAPYVTFAREGTLFAQRFDEAKLALIGDRSTVAGNVWFYRPVGGSKQSAAGGTLVSLPGGFNCHAIWLDANGHPAGEALPDAAYDAVRVAPDGKRAAMVIADVRTRVSDIFLADLQRRSLNRFTFDEQDHSAAVWSRDGHALAFAMDQNAPPYVFSQPLNGGPAVALTKPGTIQIPGDWSSNGNVFYSSAEPKTMHDIFVRDANGRSRVWLQTPNEELEARLSPDERWVSYTSNATGRNEVYVIATDRRGDAMRISVDGGRDSCWSHDGRHVYFSTTHAIYAAAVVAHGDTIEVAAPVRIYDTQDVVRGFDAAPDGRLLAIIEAADVKPLNVIVGWKRELERKSAPHAE
ncbi:MAG: eukaryotic-like serine/threonine-protein kinase [Acidobacteriota bacterium]|nr:eukaryotic-like serine/threonine-protein kinase [Acidobacteriota bacterium]